MLTCLFSDGTRKYVYGAGGLAYTVNASSGAVEVAHTDGLGSVRALTDGTGALVQTYRTDPFGVPTATQGSSAQPFGYTGEQRDAESGLVYLRARTYDPQTGRFLQRDTLAKSGPGVSGWNRYSYVANNPVNLADPTGHCPVCVAPAVPLAAPWVVAGGAAVSAEAVAFGTAVTGTAIAGVGAAGYVYDHREEVAKGVGDFFDNVGTAVHHTLFAEQRSWSDPESLRACLGIDHGS